MWCAPAAASSPAFEFVSSVRYIEGIPGASCAQIGRFGQENHYERSH